VLKEALVGNWPSPITYANPNMPQEVLDEDVIIQGFPMDVVQDKVRIAEAPLFFQKKGIPATR
jgi:hypothetical protein